jgi:hypothetical protein
VSAGKTVAIPWVVSTASGPQRRGDTVEQVGQAGPVRPDMQARLGQDHRQRTERRRVSHVAEQLERLAGQPRRVGETPGGQRERGCALQVLPLPDRTAEPVQAGAEVGELTLDGPQLTGLEQSVDPPHPAPHLDPGAAEGVGGLEHPARQHDPFGQPLRGGAGQLPGPERVDQRDRIARRFGGGQRVPADRPRPVVLAPVHQRLRVPGGHPGPQVIGKIVPGQGLLADAADLTVPFRNARGLHRQGRAGQPVPVTPAFGPPADPDRRLLRPGKVAAAVQDRRQGELEPVLVGLADLLAAGRKGLPVQTHGLLERHCLGRHVGGRLARRHRLGLVGPVAWP